MNDLQTNQGVDPLELMYDYLLAGGTIWKPRKY
jgi:hypothetical protein